MIVGIALALWLLATIAIIARAVLPVLRGEAGGVRILGAEAASGMVSVPGLMYTGYPGVALALAEMVVVVLAFFVTIRRATMLRRLGLFVIVAWCTLWAAGSVWMESLSSWNHPTTTSAAIAGAVLAAAWILLRWRTGTVSTTG